MSKSESDLTPQPPFELAIERYIDAPPAAIYSMFTDKLEEWWCPKPWSTEVIEHDLRAGGRSALIMRGPQGEEHRMEGVFLEVIPNQRVVFTDAFRAGWLPQKPFMVGFFELTAEGRGTRYRAGARHWDEATYLQHQQMGFTDGWTKVAAQLAALVEPTQRP